LVSSASEPLSQKLAQTEEEVQEARDLAAKRDRELEAALEEVTRLEAEVARVKGQRDGLANSAIGLEPGEDRLAGEVMFKDSGPKGKPHPVFAFPKASRELYEEATKRLRERFKVYLLDDGSVLFKPTGVLVDVAHHPSREQEPAKEPVQEQVAEPEGLARSPKPIAEMRSQQRDKEARLERLVQFLQGYDATFNSSDVHKDMGLEGPSPKTYVDLQELEKRGVVERTGKLVFPRDVAEARKKNPGKSGGRPAVEFRLAEEYRKQPSEPSDPQAKVRDYIIEAGEGQMVSPTQVASATEMSASAALVALEALVRRGIANDQSPSADMRLFAYAGKPQGSPRPTASQRDGKDSPSRGGGSGVAGTGKGTKSANKDVQDLINAAKRAGARVVHEASGHFAVTIPHSGKRVLISSTPSNPRTVLNDRSRLRRAGLAIT
jgi:hypothetical protein